MERLLALEHVKSIAPLDCYLGIENLPFKISAGLMLRCAYWAQNQCSYQAAEDILKKVYGIKVNDDTVRLVTNYIGKIVFDEDCRKAEEAFEKLDSGKLQLTQKRKGTLYIETDGAALNTRHKDAEGSTWRENKLGVVFSTENIHYWKGKDGERKHQITSREYISYVGSAQEFKKHLFVCALRNGYGEYKETVILSDGAAWIANMAEELFPDAQHILDYFHLSENVYTYAKAKFRMDETKYRPWAVAICEKLKEGDCESVLKDLDEKEQYGNTVNLYHYIKTNIHHIDYPVYKAKGYFIGSGAIESGNKVVLQKRLKQSGMRWNPETAQYLLTLKSKNESGLWEKDVVKLINQVITKKGVLQ